MESLTSPNSGTPVPPSIGRSTESTLPPGLGQSSGVAQVQHRGGSTFEVSAPVLDQAPSSPSGQSNGCSHSFEYVGRAVGLDKRSPAFHPQCERPNRLICRLCGVHELGRCGTTRSRRCRPCGQSHRRRVTQVAKSGTTDPRFGQLFWCTITAPGAKVLPWDSEACNHRPDIKCSGDIGCKVNGFDAAVWNGTAPKRWSWFMTCLRRDLNDHLQYFGSWEHQQRDVLHRHFLMRTNRPTPTDRVEQAVKAGAKRWGFGTQLTVEAISVETAQEKCAYLAKYSSKTVDDVDGRPVLDVRTGEIKDTRGFRAWSASRQWGETMKSVKDRQRCFAIAASGARGAPAPASAAAAAGGLESNPDISTVHPSGDLPSLGGSASSTPL